MRFIKSRWTRSTPPTHGFESDREEFARRRERARLRQLAILRGLAGTVQHLGGSVDRIEPYGAFVCGPWGHGLVHVSRMSRDFVRDPREVVKLGQPVRVWVVGVDEQQRVRLSLLPPG